jgi:hypothetical protein
VVVPVDDPWPEFNPVGQVHSAVVVGLTANNDVDPAAHRGSAWCDLVLATGDPLVDKVAKAIGTSPLAASSLAQVLRNSGERAMFDGLLMESAVYSTLQAGPEFRRWRTSRSPKERGRSSDPVVLAHRQDEHLTLALNRPAVRNALNTSMRNSLVETLATVALDPSIERVTLRGSGLCFSTGGDLDEFGSFGDPASAHQVRLASSVGRALAAVGDRVTVELHGACYGSGIEIPAFAPRIVADPDSRFALPELGLGLIPGAGGTWSLPRRIGRHRTALLALSGVSIDAPTALEWGLVDELRSCAGGV